MRDHSKATIFNQAAEIFYNVHTLGFGFVDHASHTARSIEGQENISQLERSWDHTPLDLSHRFTWREGGRDRAGEQTCHSECLRVRTTQVSIILYKCRCYSV